MKAYDFLDGLGIGAVAMLIFICVILALSGCKDTTAKIAIQNGYIQMIDLETGNPVWVRPAITNYHAPQN